MTFEGLLAVISGCFVLGAGAMAISGRRVAPPLRRQRWLKFAVYFVVVHLVLGCAWAGRSALVALGLTILAVGTWELWRAVRLIGPPPPPRLVYRIALAYAGLAGAFIATLAKLPPLHVAFLYVVVAAFDGFGQVVGQAVGRSRLAPRLSPGKTIEGTLGGAVAAGAIAVAIRDLAGLSVLGAFAIALFVALGALAGDLAASWVKRRATIKDYGTLLPGHGGVLDRFDSFIGAGALVAPAVLLRSSLGGG